jgi:hypothetical protein
VHRVAALRAQLARQPLAAQRRAEQRQRVGLGGDLLVEARGQLLGLDAGSASPSPASPVSRARWRASCSASCPVSARRARSSSTLRSSCGSSEGSAKPR